MQFLKAITLKTAVFACALMAGQSAFAQNYEWALGVGSTATGEQGNAVAVDAVGNVLVVGEFAGTADFDPSANNATFSMGAATLAGFVAKYSASGVYQWAFKLGDTLQNRVHSVTTDTANNVYIIGSFRGVMDCDPSANVVSLSSSSAATYDIFVAKYNANGVYQWAFKLGSTSDDTGGDIAIDNNGDVVVSGQFQLTTDFDASANTANLVSTGSYDAFIAKYSASTGAYVNAWRWGGTGSDRAYALAIDAANNVVATGIFGGTTDFDPTAATVSATTVGGNDNYVVEFSAAGAYMWHVQIGSTGADESLELATDASRNVYVVGYIAAAADFDPSAGNTVTLTPSGTRDGYVAKYDMNGAYQWAIGLGSSGADEARSVAVTGTTIWVTGTFANTLDFDPSANTASLASNGATDMFIARYGLNGAYIQAINAGGANAEAGRAIAATSQTVFATGSFATTADFNPTALDTNNLVSLGGLDIFAAKYNLCINPDVPTVTASAVSICEGGSSILSVDSANLGNATAWNWYTSSCGGTLVGTGATITVNPTASTTYFVRGEGGCVVAASCGSYALAVTPNPVAVTTPTNVNCYGDATGRIQIVVTNGTAPYTYAWSNGTVASPITGIIAGVYYLTVTDASGCTVTVSETITQPASALTSSISANNINCTATTGSATATAAGGTGSLMVMWSNGATTYTTTGLAAGSYSATVTDANACVSTSTTTISSTPSTLTVSANVSSNYNGANISCANANDGEATAVAGSGATPYNYMWSNGQNTAVATALGAGVFAVTATDANGCVANASVTVAAPSAVVATIASTTDATCATCPDGSASANAAGGTGSHTYLWANGQTTATATGLLAGSHTVTVTDMNGCENTATATVSFQIAVNKTLGNAISVYPNPTSQFVNVDGLPLNARLTLINALGQIIWTIETNQTTVQADLSNVVPGVYYLQIYTSQGIVSKPITRK